ncbi:MAG: RNase adapter RapZ, partial [Vicinamibacterales bacterium]|nr:RNase adapter RapZ [Vicinamibacterales bacterium]
ALTFFHALEDMVYFCVDILPTTLVPTLASLALRAGSELEKVAIVLDVREGAFVREFPATWRKLRRMKGLSPTLIFLEAADAVLVRRFSETRRPHPLAHDRPIREGIAEERSSMTAIRALADEIVDTSSLTVHELRESFMAISRGRTRRRRLQVTLLSFGFKHGLPLEADVVLDVRYLPNPHFEPKLRDLTGRDVPVADYMELHPVTMESVARFTALLQFLIPQYADEGKSYLTVAIGCTGGQHRSVYMAEALRRALTPRRGTRMHVRHRDLAPRT